MGRPLLEVVVTGPGDVAGALAGGADRLVLVAEDASGEPLDQPGAGRTPDVDVLAGVVAAVTAARPDQPVPVRPVLHAAEGYSTTGAELTRLQGAAWTLEDAGADGFVLGFLTPSLEIDTEVVTELVRELDGAPWTFSGALDAALDSDRAWRTVRELPGVDGVHTGGSARGLPAGLDELCRRARTDAGVARLAVARGGLAPEHVPWLVRAGVRAFGPGAKVRPGGSPRAWVDEGLVRAWRVLLDEEYARTL